MNALGDVKGLCNCIDVGRAQLNLFEGMNVGISLVLCDEYMTDDMPERKGNPTCKLMPSSSSVVEPSTAQPCYSTTLLAASPPCLRSHSASAIPSYQ
jgi:hypothetical protein